MATPKQIDANQRNARRSTGPKTDAGKAASARNATKHGVLSRKAVSPFEDTASYQALLKQLITDHDPGTALECLLVERLANLFWREKRLAESEAEQISREHERQVPYSKYDGEASLPPFVQILIGRYQGMLGRQISDTLRDLRAEQQRRLTTIEQPAKARNADTGSAAQNQNGDPA